MESKYRISSSNELYNSIYDSVYTMIYNFRNMGLTTIHCNKIYHAILVSLYDKPKYVNLAIKEESLVLIFKQLCDNIGEVSNNSLNSLYDLVYNFIHMKIEYYDNDDNLENQTDVICKSIKDAYNDSLDDNSCKMDKNLYKKTFNIIYKSISNLIKLHKLNTNKTVNILKNSILDALYDKMRDDYNSVSIESMIGSINKVNDYLKNNKELMTYNNLYDIFYHELYNDLPGQPFSLLEINNQLVLTNHHNSEENQYELYDITWDVLLNTTICNLIIESDDEFEHLEIETEGINDNTRIILTTDIDNKDFEISIKYKYIKLCQTINSIINYTLESSTYKDNIIIPIVGINQSQLIQVLNFCKGYLSDQDTCLKNLRNIYKRGEPKYEFLNLLRASDYLGCTPLYNILKSYQGDSSVKI